jgi:uncharacterized protein (TIGR02246 family)
MDDAIKKPIMDFATAWAELSGEKMALCFTDDAHFVAYDGTKLRGGKAIGDWHQPSLNTVLRNTTLDQKIDEIRMLTPDLALVLGSGGPIDDQASGKSKLLGDSHVTFLVRLVSQNDWKISMLQVTRKRRVTGQSSALIWQAFNFAWAGGNVDLLTRGG